MSKTYGAFCVDCDEWLSIEGSREYVEKEWVERKRGAYKPENIHKIKILERNSAPKQVTSYKENV